MAAADIKRGWFGGVKKVAGEPKCLQGGQTRCAECIGKKRLPQAADVAILARGGACGPLLPALLYRPAGRQNVQYPYGAVRSRFRPSVRNGNLLQAGYHFSAPQWLAMFSAQPVRLKWCLTWAAALGVVLAGFVARPPCQCAAEGVAEAVVACPHCQPPSQPPSQSPTSSPDACCRTSCASRGDCDCPCCDSATSDQPLASAVASGTSLTLLCSELLLVPALATFDPPPATSATGGWRPDTISTRMAPRLARLCRWII